MSKRARPPPHLGRHRRLLILPSGQHARKDITPVDYKGLDLNTLPRVTQGERAFPDVDVTYPIDGLVGGEFVIEDLALRSGTFGDFAVILMRAVLNIDEPFTTVTGGKVILRQLATMKENGCIPCVGKLGKVKNYYVFE